MTTKTIQARDLASGKNVAIDVTIKKTNGTAAVSATKSGKPLGPKSKTGKTHVFTDDQGNEYEFDEF